MKRIFKRKNKLGEYIPFSLLIGITTLCIYPVGCFSWNPVTPVRPAPVTTPAVPDDQLDINAAQLLSSLKCVSGISNADPKDLQLVSSLIPLVEDTIRNGYEKFNISIVDFTLLKGKYPGCNFP